MIHLDRYKRDLASNKFSNYGFVKADNFTKDVDLRFGISGVLWGKTNTLPYTSYKGDYWSVVKTEYSEDFIMVNRFCNEVKFQSGIILYMGTLTESANFIIKVKDDAKHCFSKEARHLAKAEIAGSAAWFKIHKGYDVCHT